VSYIIVKGGTAVLDDTGATEMDVFGDDDGQVLLFSHRIDAEDYADWLDEPVELFVIEAPEGMTGVEVL
jgi:hypothetical protein